jgi:hypothetical protein
MATTEPIMTAEQLFQAPDLGRCELVRGELIGTVTVYHLDHNAVLLQSSDTLAGGDLLPGFSIAVAEVFAS